MVAKGEIVIVQAEVFIEAGTGPCEVGESVGLEIFTSPIFFL